MDRRKAACPIAMLATLAIVSKTGHAQERERGYEASISLGYVGTTGNTESQTIETRWQYTFRSRHWVHGLQFQGLYTKQESATTGQRLFVQGKSDYEFEKDYYAFVKASYTDDRFTGFDYQTTLSVGYGHYFYNREDLLLEAFAGVGYRENGYFEEGLDDEGEAIVSVGENLEWAFTDTTEMTQSLMSEIGEDLVVTRFEIGLVSTLISRLATKIAFQIRHISDVPPDRNNTDTQTSISLVYEF